MFRFFHALFAAALVPMAAVRAQTPLPSSSSPGDSLSISVLTMGQGEELWELFGHDAIWIHDAVTHTDSVYNWGVFDMSQPNFIPRFLQGLNLYTMDGESFDSVLRQYRSTDRTVWVQSLDLTAAQRVAVRDYIRWNEQSATIPAVPLQLFHR